MDNQGKLSLVKTSLGISASDDSYDLDILAYLDMAGETILNWMYTHYPEGHPADMEVPRRYSMVQINAVVAGYSHRGAEGETVHNENGINRTFKDEDMDAYITKSGRVAQILYLGR